MSQINIFEKPFSLGGVIDSLQTNIFENHFKSIFPELFLITAIFIILLYAVIINPMAQLKFPILTSIVGWLSIQSLIITILLIGNQSISASTLILNNVLIVDEFSVIIKIIILFSALSSILISFDYIKTQKINSFEYMILILFSTLSMLFLVSSYDLISMYLAIELQSLSFYVIAAFQRNSEFSTEAGLKYFILGALSSGLLLFGESIIYGFTGITNFEELSKLLFFHSNTYSNNITQVWDSYSLTSESLDSERLSDLPDILNIAEISTNAVIIGALFIIIAFLFKISAAPFHMWTPDVYEGAPTSVTAFFAITPKIAILALLLRLCLFTFYNLIESWQTIIIFCAILSIFVGTFGAINQNKIKRLFAYSSIAHVGYILIGLAAASIEAIESVLLYIILYIPMMINVFGILLAMPKQIDHDSDKISNNSLFYQVNPVLLNYSYKWNSKNTSLKNIKDLQIDKTTSKNTFDLETWETSIFKASHPIWNPYSSIISTKDTSSNFYKKSLPFTGIKSFTFIKKKETLIKYITDLAAVSKSNKLLGATFAIILFSNAGVPPLSGFYGKLNIFLASVEANMYFLAITGVICSVMGAFYSIRLIKIIYFHTLTSGFNHWTWYKQISKENSIVLGITLFFTLLFFLYPSFLFTITHLAALSLCL